MKKLRPMKLHFQENETRKELIKKRFEEKRAEKVLKMQFAKQLIRVGRCRPDGSLDEESRIRIPRFKLSAAFLEKHFGFEVLHLRDTSGIDVIWPDDIQRKCRPEPMIYYAVARVRQAEVDALHDSSYEGDTALFAMHVPARVEEDDLRHWLRAGLAEESNATLGVRTRISRLQEHTKVLDQKLSRVPYVSPEEVGMVARNQMEAALARKKYATYLLNEKDEAEATIERLQGDLRRMVAKQMKLPIFVTCEGSDDLNDETRRWSVRLIHRNEEAVIRRMLTKPDWVEIVVGLQDALNGREPWAGRQNHVPERYKLEDAVVEMRTVTLERLPHGHGTSYQNAPHLSTYEGAFDHGRRQGAGVTYGRDGEYTGHFVRGQRRERGALTLPEGHHLEGDFDVRHRHPPSLLGNPERYDEGLPQGHATVAFSDGAQFEGDMRDGLINGPGRYVASDGSVTEGVFQDGDLHGRGLVERSNGDLREGTWRHGVLHGGAVELVGNEEFEGTFVDGERSLYGQLTQGDGARYDGQFMFGERNGCGQYTYGNVSVTFDRRKQQHVRHYDARAFGSWRAGMLTSGGVVEQSDGRQWFTINGPSRRYPQLAELRAQEILEARERKGENVQRVLDDEEHRHVVERGKLKVWRQELRHAGRLVSRMVTRRRAETAAMRQQEEEVRHDVIEAHAEDTLLRTDDVSELVPAALFDVTPIPKVPPEPLDDLEASVLEMMQATAATVGVPR